MNQDTTPPAPERVADEERPDLLDVAEEQAKLPAERLGFEPLSYTERS